MESREDVTASIKAVRKSPMGLTKGSIETQQPLLRVLETDDPSEGVARLSAAVERLTQVENPAYQDDARGLRAALGIGLPPLKNVTARRSEARKLGLFFGQPRTQYDAEDRAIKRLVELLFEEATSREQGGAEIDAFQEATNQQLADPSLIAPVNDKKSSDQPLSPTGSQPETSLLARLGSWADQRQQVLAHTWEPRPLRDRLNSWKRDWAAVSREAKIFLLLFVVVVLLGGMAALITLTR